MILSSVIFSPYILRIFITGFMLAVTMPCIGMVMALKRLSMIGDALSHTSLAGVAVGLIFGFNPIAGAVAACIFAALSIEAIRKYIPRFSEMAISIIMSAGIGIAGLLINFVKTPANFNQFLFGSLALVSKNETYMIIGLSALVLAMFLVLYRQLFYVSFDEHAARLSGVRVKSVNFLFTIMTAVTVSVASRIVGALVVSSIMILPVACSMQFNKGYKHTLILSCLFAALFMCVGIAMSIFLDLKTSGSIVLLAITTFVIILVVKTVAIKIKKRKKIVDSGQQNEVCTHE